MNGFEITALQPVQVENAAHLTFRAMRHLLPLVDGKRFIAAAAWHGGQAAGLALVGPNLLGKPDAQLYSIMVTPACRRQGLGGHLLASVMQQTAEAGQGALVSEWSDRLPGAAALAGLLQGAGWTAPQRVSLRLQSRVDRTERVFVRRAALLARLARDGVALHPWGTLGPAERLQVTATLDSLRLYGLLPDWADPAGYLEAADPAFTLMIRDGAGQWRGWIICQHQMQAERWFFPIGWVHPADAGRGWLMAAIAQVTAMMEEQVGPHAVAAFEASHFNPAMWTMLEKHFFPHATLADYLLSSRTTL